MVVRERAVHFIPDDPVALTFNCEPYYYHMAITFFGVWIVLINYPALLGAKYGRSG